MPGPNFAQIISNFRSWRILREKSIEAVSIMHHVSREGELDVFVHKLWSLKKNKFSRYQAKGIKIQNHGSEIIPKKNGWLGSLRFLQMVDFRKE